MGGFGHQYGVRQIKVFFIPIILNVKYSLFYFYFPKLCGSAALTFKMTFCNNFYQLKGRFFCNIFAAETIFSYIDFRIL